MNLRVIAACTCCFFGLTGLTGLVAQSGLHFNPGPQLVWEHNGPPVSPDDTYGDEAAFAVVHGPGDEVYMLAVNSFTGDWRITAFDTPTGTPGWSAPWPAMGIGCAIAMVGADKIICLGRTPSIVTLLLLSTDGAVLWSRGYPEIGTMAAGTPDPVMVVDSNGQISVSAATGPYDQSDVTTMKLDQNGDIVWQETYTGPGDDAPLAITVDGEDNVIVVGFTTLNEADSRDHLVLKYAPTGSLDWMWTAHSTDRDVLYAVEIDAADNIYASGSVKELGYAAGYVVELSPAGNLVWSDELEDAVIDQFHPSYIALDAEGNVVAAFACAEGDRLCKYTADGTLLWSVPLFQDIVDLMIASDGQILVAGQRPPGSTGLVAWINSYRPTGQALWYHELSGSNGNSLTYRGTWPLIPTAGHALITVGDQLDMAHIEKLCLPPLLNCMETAILVPVPEGINAIAGYFDADTDLDLAMWSYYPSGVELLAGNGDATFASTGFVASERIWPVYRPFRVLPSGPPGLMGAFVNPPETAIQLFAPDGQGSFVALPLTELDSTFLELETADLDGMLGDDLVLRFDWPLPGVRIFLNDGTGMLQPYGNLILDAGTKDIGLGDLTGDGIPDLVVSMNGSPMQLRAGLGNGTFMAPTPITTVVQGGTIFFGDADLDGVKDLITAHYGPPQLVTYLQQGSGVGPGVAQPIPVDPRGGVITNPFYPSLRIPYIVATPGNGPSLVYPGDSCSTTGWGSSRIPWEFGLPHIGDFNGDGRPDLGQFETRAGGQDYYMLYLNCGDDEDINTAIAEDFVPPAEPVSCGTVVQAGSRTFRTEGPVFQQGTKVETFDLRGSLVHSTRWNGTSLDLGPLDPGIYLVRASGTAGVCVSKIFLD